MILATTINWTLLTNKESTDYIRYCIGIGKIDDFYILMTQQNKRREKDQKVKAILYDVLPLWSLKHVVWPIALERGSTKMFMARSFLANDVDEFIDSDDKVLDNVTEVANAFEIAVHKHNISSHDGLVALLNTKAATLRFAVSAPKATDRVC